MRAVTWAKGPENEWLDFLKCDLTNVQTFGVYIIWHAGERPKTVYIGYGHVKERLHAHCMDSRILTYLPKGLLVTWAEVPAMDAAGVVRYLADRLRPLVEVQRLDVRPIPVNSPAAA
jgi:hypothetical protein